MFGFIRKRESVGEQTRMYKIGKAYGYLEALQELSQSIVVESEVRRDTGVAWDLNSFSRWLDGEVVRMVRAKKQSFDITEITRLQDSLESLANRRYRR